MPATSKFILPAHPVNMHNDVVNWISELEFCELELAFFRKLLKQNNFYTASNKKQISYYSLALKIKRFQEKNLKSVFKDVIKHEHRLSELDKNKIVSDEKALAKEHKKYALGVKAIDGSVKKIKKELFTFIEKQLTKKKKKNTCDD